MKTLFLILITVISAYAQHDSTLVTMLFDNVVTPIDASTMTFETVAVTPPPVFKFTIKPVNDGFFPTNLDTLLKTLITNWPGDITKYPKGTKFYEIGIIGTDGVIEAAKPPGKQWNVYHTQFALDAIGLSVLYHRIYEDVVCYKPIELYDVKFTADDGMPLKMEVHRKVDNVLVATFNGYFPKNYLIPRK